MENNMAIISIVVLAIAVAVAFIKKINIGFFAIGAAFILGSFGGMSAKEIAKGFSSSMFVTLVGVTFFFGMASQNGTLDLFSKKIVAMVGKKTYLIPVLMFALSAFISAIGPGHIAAGILMTTFAVYLALELKINPMATALYAKLGANAGCASTLSMTGILAKNLADDLKYEGPSFGVHLFLSTLLSGFLFTLVVYILYKGYAVKADNPLKLSEIPKFNREQKLTMAMMAAVVIIAIGFQKDTGLCAFVAASVLVLLKCADEKKAIKSIPWGTLVMVCGVGVLVNVMDVLGGISLISNGLQSMMTDATATPIMAACSGILSWVSSTTGVVMPTLFPIADQICKAMQGVNFVELIAAIVATSFASAISPLSTGGAIIMSSYSASTETTTEEMNNMFKTLFLLSVANMVMNVVLSALGVFNLGGLFY